eukprot:12299136-Ditylum_brightwellii.AAC.1
MAVHQCARFINDPKLLHEHAVRQIVKYFSVNLDKGIIYRLDLSLGIQCYVDADFTGSWSKADANNPSM